MDEEVRAHRERRAAPGMRGMPFIAPSTTSRKTEEKETSWINKVRKKVNLAHPMNHPDKPCTIFQVPKQIRRLDPKAYEPVVASFGPFHRYLYEGFITKHHKWRCVRHLLSRHGSQEHASQLLDKCLLELKKQDDKIRSCYSQELSELDAHKMASIMLLDGCFIIHLMLKMCARKESSKEERKKEKGMEENREVENVGGKLEEYKTTRMGEREVISDIEEELLEGPTMAEGDVVLNIREEEQLEGPTVAGLFTFDLVVYDLLKLENQIPFFIIQLLFDNLKTHEDENIDLVDLALQLFKDIHPKESKSFKKKPPKDYHHLLHLFYSSRIPSEKPAESTSAPGCTHRVVEHLKSKWKKAEADPSQRTPTSAPKWIPTATELNRAGVKFKRKEPTDSFLNITFAQRKMKLTPLLCLWKLYLIFKSGQMEIPPLQIYDYTSPLLRNLIAFEQCYFDTEMYITIYALFMDCIIDQAEDARLLHLEGILEHKLSNDQAVAELFNQLGNQIHFVLEKNYLANQIERVNEFCESKWHKWLAGLRRDYLGNPWTTISVLAATFLLLLTVEQATFAALSYFHS